MIVSDAPSGRLADLPLLLKPTPGRFEFAFRLALIAALTTLIGEVYQIPFIALSAYVPLFFNKPDRVGSLIMNVGALVAVSILVALIFPLAGRVMDAPLWRMVSMVLISLGVLFLASIGGAQAIGGIVALVLVFALNLMGMVPLGEIATRALLYGWLIIALPALVSIVVNLVLAPAPRRLASRAIGLRLRLAAERLLDGSEASRRRFSAVVDHGDAEIRKWLKFAALEKTSPAEDIRALQRANDSTVQILALTGLATHEPSAALPRAVRQRLAEVLEPMADALEDGGYPVDIHIDLPLDAAETLSPAAAEVLDGWCQAITGFPEPTDEVQAVLPEAVKAEPEPEAESRPEADAVRSSPFSDHQHIRYAIKTTGAAMLCYLIYTLLDWPGIHTCMITCYIVALGTTAETTQKVTLRMVGCVLGGVVGVMSMLFIVPDLHAGLGLVAVVFLGMLGANWVSAGSPRIAYAGFQIGFAFLLCVLQGWGPGFDMAVARDRVIGVLLGNFVVYLLFTHVWPVSVSARIDPAIATVLRQLRALLGGAKQAAEMTVLAQVQAGLGRLKQDLALTGYEPKALRPAGDWAQRRGQAIRELQALSRLLVLGSLRAPSAFSRGFGARLQTLVRSLEGGFAGAPVSSLPIGGETVETSFFEVPAIAHLNSLEKTLLVDQRASVGQVEREASADVA